MSAGSVPASAPQSTTDQTKGSGELCNSTLSRAMSCQTWVWANRLPTARCSESRSGSRMSNLLGKRHHYQSQTDRQHRVSTTFALAEADALALRLHEIAHVLHLVEGAQAYFFGVQPMVLTRFLPDMLRAPQQQAAVEAGHESGDEIQHAGGGHFF